MLTNMYFIYNELLNLDKLFHTIRQPKYVIMCWLMYNNIIMDENDMYDRRD